MAWYFELAVSLSGPVITAIGIYVAYKAGIKRLKDEIGKLKKQLAINNLESVPYDLLMTQRDILAGKIDETGMQYDCTLAKIFTYGSNEAIRILSGMKKWAYSGEDKQAKEYRDDVCTAYNALLVAQIKYDITTEITSPLEWFYISKRRCATDSDYTDKLIQITNKLVKQFKLDTRFQV